MFKDSKIMRDSFQNFSTFKETIYKCNGCRICSKECAFLDKYGNPGHIAKLVKKDPEKWQAVAFECSLCGLCSAVCPQNIDVPLLFLDMRKKAFIDQKANFAEHNGILNYEKRGTSKRYSYYSLPENCDTVFFPGCTLPGTRPDTTFKTFKYLEKQIDNLGMVLDCCTKPSHDLGRQDFFDAMFGEMKTYLLKNNVTNIIVACPNCHRIFKTYGKEFHVQTAYEVMEQTGLNDSSTLEGEVTIHDPCPVRFENKVHDAVRILLQKIGLEIKDTRHSKTKTLCCGEGGSVGCMAPELANNWTNKRVKEAGNKKIVSYCAGCVNFLSKKTDSFHLLDLVFDPENTLRGKAKVSKAPFTYLNRLKLKNTLKKQNAAITRERDFSPIRKEKKGMGARLMVLALIIATMAGIRAFGLTDYLDQEKMRAWIEGYGNLGPFIYIFIYTIAPALFLPGLPITIAGGILFGPFWGVVYTITGSTMGAGLAFLISRYISRDFIESRMTGPKWVKLQEEVEKQGWKVVAVTRLVPLFPFNLLNYAFGLTRIKFSHYMVTTFICMLPACIAFIVFSSSFLALLKGRISNEFVLGALLIAMVSVAPVLYNKIKKKGVL